MRVGRKCSTLPEVPKHCIQLAVVVIDSIPEYTPSKYAKIRNYVEIHMIESIHKSMINEVF